MSLYCHNENEHRRKAEQDARYNRRDRDMYEHHSFDDCKKAYTDSYDREYRRQERLREEREEEEREEARRIEHQREMRRRAEEADEEAERMRLEENEYWRGMEEQEGHPIREDEKGQF